MQNNHFNEQRNRINREYLEFKEDKLLKKNNNRSSDLKPLDLTRRDIMGIKDNDLRQKAIQENIHLFR